MAHYDDQRESAMYEDYKSDLFNLTKNEVTQLFDNVEKPKHYNIHPSGIQCIEITEHMNFCLGNAIKYLWRAGIKNESAREDLKKAVWYIEREIKRLDNDK